MGHLPQKRLGVSLHDGEFEDEGGIESGVGIFLEGENPFFLPPAHTRPASDGLDGGGVAIFMIAHDAAKQAVVGGGNPVMVVDAEGGEGRDVDLEYVVGGESAGEFRVKAVDTLDKEDVVGVEAERAGTLDAGA